ncbi:ABC-type oligopeptide transport system, periplasmic component [Levilactobacillus paucivorans]|uniref:ABC-type oligopeptide transport system, periplasmic component n=1 Tax=Levilactobacillus paucivorans TaxID=616990 RepID=A0A0R2L7I5_9LACO|nr:peptide ABC transporter substrate-binding protein [Levilactobacillus paucivorans]KRN97726.1 ABC-type oligopeptide transport system, periplasmic component [Levilactobacillus paucivorans]
MKHWRILGILMLCIILTGCSTNHETDTTSDSQGVMTKNQDLTLTTTHPITSLDTDKLSQFGRLNNTIEGLYSAMGDSDTELALAKKVKINASRTTYTFTLWKDSYWSNGDLITASDFVFAWQRALQPRTKSPNADLFDGIKNARQILNGKLPASQLGVSAPDKFTLVVHLDHPMAELPQRLAFPLFGPQNEKFAKRMGKRYGTKPQYHVYAGPFMVSSHKFSIQHWHMVPNPHYWDRKHVYLRQIDVRMYPSQRAAWNAYESGTLDEIRLVNKTNLKSFEKSADYTARPYSKMVNLVYRQRGHAANTPLMRQKTARLAISHAINRQVLTQASYGSTSLPAKGIVPAGLSRGVRGTSDFAAAQPEQKTLAFLPKTAQAEWLAALKATHQKRVTLTLGYSDIGSGEKVAKVLKQQLVGTLPRLSITLKPRQEGLNRDYAPVTADMTVVTQRAQYADPLAMLDLFTSDNAANFGHWSNETYDDLIDQASNAPSFNSQRWQTLLKAEGLLMQEQGATPLIQPASTYLVNPKLNGVVYNTVGTQSNFKSAYFVH